MRSTNGLLAFGLLALMFVPLSTQAQVFPGGNGISLSNRYLFDLYVRIGDWKDMRQDATEFRLNTLHLFEADLREAGISRRPANRNYLVCSVQATRVGNRIAYATAVEYWSLESTDVHVLQWQHSTINAVASNRFNERQLADECAAPFITEWQKWNPAQPDDQ